MKALTTALFVTVTALTACDTSNKTPKTAEGGIATPSFASARGTVVALTPFVVTKDS